MTSSSSVSILRAIANRLTNTPVEKLPAQIGFLATSLSDCRDLLQTSDSTKNDIQLLIHKLKTRTSSLLQDRSPEGRLAGIILVRSLVEAGGRSFLADSNSWVRALITCLNKSDPFQVKQLAILAITRIYRLCAGDQTLVREIVTPTLPAYINASLGVIKPASRTTASGGSRRVLSPLLQPILQSWHALIERFASTIRPNVSSIKAISLSLLSDSACPATVRKTATDVLAWLHHCAPKTGGATEWAQLCTQAIESAHDTADLVFRALIEDWSSATSRVSNITKKQKAASEPATQSKDVLGLGEWTGVTEGCSRICAQLDLLKSLSVGTQSQAVILPIGKLIELVSRLSSVTLPTARYALRHNNEITREEREELYLNLPRIHVSLLQLFNGLCRVYDQHLLSVSPVIAEQTADIFEAEYRVDGVREAVYSLVQTMLSRSLYSPTKQEKGFITQLTECVCNDLLPSSSSTKRDNNTSNPSQLTLSTDAESMSNTFSQKSTTLYATAQNLLPTLLTHLPFHYFSSSVRTRLDQTAILTQNQQALVASVLNPARARSTNGNTSGASLLPFLARGTFDHGMPSLAKEALLRPRMPVLRVEHNIEMKDGRDESSEAEEHEDDNERTLERTNGVDSAMDDSNIVSTATGSTTMKFTAMMDSSTTESHKLSKRTYTALLEPSDPIAVNSERPNDVGVRSFSQYGTDRNDHSDIEAKKARFGQHPSSALPASSALNALHQSSNTILPSQSTLMSTSNPIHPASQSLTSSQHADVNHLRGSPFVSPADSAPALREQSRTDSITTSSMSYPRSEQEILDPAIPQIKSSHDNNNNNNKRGEDSSDDDDDDEIPLIDATLRTFSDESDDENNDDGD